MVFTTGSDVSATPTVAGDAVYFPHLERPSLRSQEEQWPSHLFLENPRLRWRRRSGLSRQSGPEITIDNFWGYAQ